MENKRTVLTTFKTRMIVSAVAVAMLTACGGGGGGGGGTSGTSSTGGTLSGTAAGGAPVVGTVEVKDSKGATKQGTIEANGHYSVDVAGMTGPFMLKATGTVGNTAVTYYSAATNDDLNHTVNVTPFTNLIVSNIAGQLVDNYYASNNPSGSLITTTNLNTAKNDLLAKISPALQALGLETSIDLLRTSFAADHSGIDKALDAVKVSVNPLTNVATLYNAITQATLVTDNLTTRGDDATPAQLTTQDQTALSAAGTDIQNISGNMQKFAALFATSLPTVQQMQNLGIFDEINFMESGKGFAQWASQLSTNQTAMGLTLSNVAIDFDSATTGTVRFVVHCGDCRPGEVSQFKISKASGAWLMQGDGTLAGMGIDPIPRREISQNQDVIKNGLNAWVNPSAYNGTHQTKIETALVTGPGLGAGVTLVSSPQNSSLGLSPNGDNLIPECGGTVVSNCVDLSFAVAGAEYTVVLKDASGNALNGGGDKIRLLTAAIPTSQLTSAMFPVAASWPTLAQMIPNANIQISWTLPAGFGMNDVNLDIWGGGTSYQLRKETAATATSVTLALGSSPDVPSTADSFGIWMRWCDSQYRCFGTSYREQKQNPL